MGTAAPPAVPHRPVRNTASRSGTAYSSKQGRFISQLTLISGGRSPIRHLGTRRVGDGRPSAEVDSEWPRKYGKQELEKTTSLISRATCTV